MPSKRHLTHQGRTLHVREWARLTGLHLNTILGRLKRGWPAEKALSAKPDERFQPGYQRPAPTNRPVPPMKIHAGGQACARWSEHGKERIAYFGRAGSAEAVSAYARFAAEWAVGNGTPADPRQLSVGELVEAWLDWVQTEYVKDGRPTSEQQGARAATRPLLDLYSESLASEFGPLQLKAVRQAMVAKRWVRSSINQHVSRIVRCFRWGVSEGLVEPAIWQALKSLTGLRSGRGHAPDNPPRESAPDEDVEAAVASLHHRRRSMISDMVRLQRLTGMRPGEVCSLRPEQIDRSADVWVYEPPGHKNQHRGQRRRVHLGPRAQTILLPRLHDAVPTSRVFPITVTGYGTAIRQACKRAKVKPWTPHQLRHSLATEVARRYASLETAAAAIGDTPGTAARHYVHIDPQEKARIDVARDMG